jgi:hypothetical protein
MTAAAGKRTVDDEGVQGPSVATERPADAVVHANSHDEGPAGSLDPPVDLIARPLKGRDEVAQEGERPHRGPRGDAGLVRARRRPTSFRGSC